MLSVIALVVLRVCIGWHFFYEGTWKIANADQFSSLPFLTMAKGPFAPFFYAMAPDLDGVERLKTEEREVTFYTPDKIKVDLKKPGDQGFEGKTPDIVASKEVVEKTEKILVYPAYFEPIEKIYNKALKVYKPEGEQLKAFQLAWGNYVTAMSAAQKAKADDITAYLGNLERFRAAKNGPNNGPEQKKRQWADMLKLRAEAKGFCEEQQALCDAFVAELTSALTPDQNANRLPKFIVKTDQLPFGLVLPIVGGSWTEFLDFTVTWALTLIGLCLMIGLCTRFAAVGGGCFLIFVLMTQPPWPTLFPAVNPEVGHALIVDKNFVEMVAIFMLATLPVGRWGGLDYFLWRWIVKPIFVRLGWYVDEDAPEAAN